MAHNRYLVFICFFGLLQIHVLFGQSTDILRLEYLKIPENNSGIRTERYKFLFNLPIKLNEKKDYLVTGVEYNRFDVGFSQNFPFDQSELNRFHVVDLNLGFITKWNENWNFIGILTPRLASNFTGGIQTSDLFINATATLLKQDLKAEKPFRIALGLSFNSTTGLPFPLPLVSYYRRFHPNWSFTLGIPRTRFEYHPTPKHTLGFTVLLDGYFINIQNNIELPDSRLGSKISLSALVGAFNYQYNITRRVSLFAFLGRSITQEGVLRDNGRSNVFSLNNDAIFYLRTGFKIGIF